MTARDVNTGAVRTSQSDINGRFLLAQLNPGTYQIEVAAQGFAIQDSLPIVVAVGQIATANFTLAPAGTSQSVEVNAQSALMGLEDPNTSTTLDAKTISNLPNPGQDLTYVAQFAQGALMNTAGSSNDAKAAGGYGNVEFTGCRRLRTVTSLSGSMRMIRFSVSTSDSRPTSSSASTRSRKRPSIQTPMLSIKVVTAHPDDYFTDPAPISSTETCMRYGTAPCSTPPTTSFTLMTPPATLPASLVRRSTSLV